MKTYIVKCATNHTADALNVTWHIESKSVEEAKEQAYVLAADCGYLFWLKDLSTGELIEDHREDFTGLKAAE